MAILLERIREGVDSSKIAVIGRKMPGVVDPTADYLRKNGIKVETFSDDKAWTNFKKMQEDYNEAKGLPRDMFLPIDEVIKTELYKNNKKWAQKLKEERYTVIDIGNPKEIIEMSAFYSIEKKILFGE